jgi:WD40 repeat protein
VFIDRAGRARLGVAQVIAKPAHANTAASTATGNGGSSSSSAPAEYTAPELRRASAPGSDGAATAAAAVRPPTSAADVYAWGALAAEVLSWVHFDGDDAATGAQVARPPAPPALTPDADTLLPPGTPPAVVELVRRCWDAASGSRPTAAVLAQQMGDALARRTGDRGHACCLRLGQSADGALAAFDARAAEVAAAAGYAYVPGGGASATGSGTGEDGAVGVAAATVAVADDVDGATHFTAARAHGAAAHGSAVHTGTAAYHTTAGDTPLSGGGGSYLDGRDGTGAPATGAAATPVPSWFPSPSAAPASSPRQVDPARRLRRRQQREDAELTFDQRHAAEWQFAARLTAGGEFGRPCALLPPRRTGWRRLLQTLPRACGGGNDGHVGTVTGVAGLPDGLLATCGLDGDIKVWRLPPTGSGSGSGGGRLSLLSTLQSDGVPQAALLALPRGRLLSLDYAGDLRAWAITASGDGVCVGTLPGNGGGVTVNAPLAVLPDGRLAIHDGAGRLVMWELGEACGFVRDGATAPIAVTTGKLTDVVALRDGRLAVGTDDGCVSVWAPPLDGGGSGIGSGSSCDDGTAAVWEMDALWPAHSYGRVAPLLALRDGSLVTGGDGDRAVRRWVCGGDGSTAAGGDDGVDDASGAGGWHRAGTLDGALDARGRSTLAVLPADGRVVVTSSPSAGQLALWASDADGGFRADGGLSVGGGGGRDGSAVLVLAALRDGRLVGGCADGAVCVWR